MKKSLITMGLFFTLSTTVYAEISCPSADHLMPLVKASALKNNIPVKVQDKEWIVAIGRGQHGRGHRSMEASLPADATSIINISNKGNICSYVVYSKHQPVEFTLTLKK